MQSSYVFMIVLMGIATYLTRVFFLVLSRNRQFPPLVMRSLKYIPVSILTALIVPGIFMPEGSLELSLRNPYLWAALITIGAVLVSRNSIISILLGISSLIIFRLWI